MFKASFGIPYLFFLTFAKDHYGKGDQLANLREEKVDQTIASTHKHLAEPLLMQEPWIRTTFSQ